MRTIILFMFLISCSSANIVDNNLNFDKEMTYNEFKMMLNKYDKISGYPDIDD